MKQFKITLTVTAEDKIHELDIREYIILKLREPIILYNQKGLMNFTDKDAIYVERIK